MSITAERKTALIKENATKPNDTGSPEVQVAILTARINHLTEHFNKADVDHFSRLGVIPITERGNTYTGEDADNKTHRKILMHYAIQEQRLREIVRDHNVTHI